MLRNLIPAIALTATLSACWVQPEQLNSERIEDRFGNYGITVIEQDEAVRRSILYSVDEAGRTCRTYAVVMFGDSDAADIDELHRRILDGASIGSTFRSSGWSVRKETIHVGEMHLDDYRHPVGEMMRLTADTDLAVHAYELHVSRDDVSVHYATIVETHHPDYLDLEELGSLYPLREKANGNTINEIRQLVLEQY